MDPSVSAAAIVGVFAWLEFKHFIFDYVLQTPFQFRNKGTYGHPGGILHSGLHAIGTIPIFFLAWPGWLWAVIIVIAEFVIHYHVDWSKEQSLRRLKLTTTDKWYWRIYGMDQFAHQATYVLIAAILAGVI